MADARMIVLVVAGALLAAGVVPLLLRAGVGIAGTTLAGKVLDGVWTAAPLLFAVVLVIVAATA